MWLYLNVPSPKASDPAMLRLTPVPATPGAADWVKWLRYNRVTKEVALRLLVGPTTTANARAWAPQYRAWFLNMTDKKGVAMFQDVLVEVLTDKATFLSMKANLNLSIVLKAGDDLKNTYSLIACNPDKNTGLNTEGAQAFIDWMTKQETLDKIAAFGTTEYGEGLFFVDM